MRQLTPEQLAARDERRIRFRAIVKQLAELPEAERAERMKRIGFVKLSTQSPYSPANSMLIAFQSVGHQPTILGGFAEWKKQGRAVRKGEHGYMIWVPIGIKKEEIPAVGTNGELTTMLQEVNADVHFTIGTVFDISQTEEIGNDKIETVKSADQNGKERA